MKAIVLTGTVAEIGEVLKHMDRNRYVLVRKPYSTEMTVVDRETGTTTAVTSADTSLDRQRVETLNS